VTAPPLEALGRDHGISRATAYRYVDEVIAVLADQAPGQDKTELAWWSWLEALYR
jgi:hypothetical protein